MSREKADPALIDSIEAFLMPIIAGLEPDGSPGPGRPRVLPAMALWAGMLVCIARGYSAQLELWRLLNVTGLWEFPRFPLSDAAVYKRLKQAGSETLQMIFEKVTALLKGRIRPVVAGMADFAPGIFALDETTLDAVMKRLPSLRNVGGTVLGGKLATLFDIRSQLWHRIEYQTDPDQNEKVAARGMLAFIPKGSLLLADMGYFAFEWFDDLTRLGYHWISRLRAKTTYEISQTLYKGPGVLDAIVWLGVYRADRAAHAVRLVSYIHKGQTRTYITNVLDPDLLSIRDISLLYARRWDIEMMFDMVKTHLNLHMLWSSHVNVILHQVFAVFTVAQIILGMRSEIAERANADIFEVSLDLMIRWIPRFAHAGLDPIVAIAERGRFAKIIRPTTRINVNAPEPPLTEYSPLDSAIKLTRQPRYAHKA